jgi:hypothetical protein
MPLTTEELIHLCQMGLSLFLSELDRPISMVLQAFEVTQTLRKTPPCPNQISVPSRFGAQILKASVAVSEVEGEVVGVEAVEESRVEYVVGATAAIRIHDGTVADTGGCGKLDAVGSDAASSGVAVKP